MNFFSFTKINLYCFSKWMLGWVTPTVISSGMQEIMLENFETSGECLLIFPVIELNDIFSEFFLVENRQATGNDSNVSWFHPDGLSVWHIDSTRDAEGTSFANNNSLTEHKLVKLMEDWHASRTATGNIVQICSDWSCASVVREMAVGSSITQWTVTPELQKGTLYFWRVRGENACGMGPCSPAYLFYTTDCPSPFGIPRLTSPGDGAVVCLRNQDPTAETCNSLDDDCDGSVDEGCQTYYRDSDRDTFGDPGNTTVATIIPRGYVTDDTDCDDTNALVYPGANEICDGLDNDCNSRTADGTDESWFGVF